MKCAKCGTNCEHPLCEDCAGKHLIAYLREHWDTTVRNMSREVIPEMTSPEEFSHFLFDQDVWFDIYPRALYDSLEWFWGDGYHNNPLLQSVEALMWMAITCGYPNLQEVILDVHVDGL